MSHCDCSHEASAVVPNRQMDNYMSQNILCNEVIIRFVIQKAPVFWIYSDRRMFSSLSQTIGIFVNFPPTLTCQSSSLESQHPRPPSPIYSRFMTKVVTNTLHLELHQIKEGRHNVKNRQNKNYNSENRTTLRRGQFQIIWTHRSQVSFLTGSNKHSCCKFFHVSFLLPSSVFWVVSLFLYFLFTSLFSHAIIPHLALADYFSTLSPRLHAKDTFARYLPHLRAYFFLRCSLIGRLWSSFLSTIFLM